jgi:CheY-like chemotaxis protein
VNLTGARLLGLERSHLVGKHLGILLSADSRPAFHAFCTKAFATGKKETCEVLVRPELTSPVAVELVATSAAGGNECRLVATDITARKRPDALMAIRLRLQEFASSRSPKELLQKTLDEVEALTGSRVGFFHYLEADQRTPSLQVWSTRTVPEPGADAGGKQALELVRRHGARISLVVLDITMPEMSGRQTYEAMQKLRPGIKVLLCSGSSIEGHAQALLDSGCNGFIQKPFDAAVLAAKVRELL